MALYQSSFFPGSYAGPRCSRCHRPLTDPVSINTGMGPECRSMSGRKAGGDLCVREQFGDEFAGGIPFAQALVLQRRFDSVSDEKGIVVTNVPHLVVHHSPDGFEFGYSGSGPTDLALNICQLYLNMTGYEGDQTKLYDGKCWSLAWALRIDFRNHFLSGAPNTGTIIPFEKIDAWFKSQLTSELLSQHSMQIIEE